MEKAEEKSNLVDNNDGDYDGVDLQLSLGPSKKLRRSSSIVVECGGSSIHARGEAVEPHAPLGRTCSLPAVSEEEFRKRKEEQTARRLEARKKRLEKKNAASRAVVKEKESSSDDGSNNNALENNNHNLNNNNNNNNVAGVERSIGSSQRTGSSGVCDPPSQLFDQAQNTEVRSPPMARPIQVQAPQEQQGRPPVPADRNGVGKRRAADMPYVSTRDGNRIEGFLYRYRKGEEVKIVCVCHGLFLSPAEFVKHGGGGDVDNPLRHIVVNPSPPLV